MGDVQPDPVAATPEPKPRVRRVWFPAVVLLLAALGILAVQVLLNIDTGGRRMLSFMISAAAFLAVAFWFLLLAGLPGRVRLAGAALLVGAVALLVGSVRRVEFSGDMEPTFDFRWSPDRMAVLEEHRASQKEKTAETVKTANLADVQAGPLDVLEYRGPHRDGISAGPKLARDWSQQPPKQVWRQPVGGGYASFLVIGPALVTIEQRHGDEAVVAYDADTGSELWVYQYEALFSEQLGGDGPRATPEYFEGKIYALGATGQLTALELATGKALWSLNILKENGSGNLDWGMSGSPLVYDGIVLVNPGNQKGGPGSRSIVAYDLADGKRRWAAGETKASYASPMLATLDGQQQLLIFDAVGLAGHDPGDGRVLWRFPWKSDFDINAAQPFIVDKNRVLITSATGAALLSISQADGKWTVEPVWQNKKLKGGYSSPIVHEGYVYGIDENILVCLGLEKGDTKWKVRAGQVGHGQILLRDGLLLVLGEAGELVLVEATPERYHELGRIQAIEGKTWNVPVLVGNRIYVRNHLEMAAYDLPTADDASAAAAEPEAPQAETPNPDTPSPKPE
jgi:outer membrane protein assembly factor BamB